MQINEETESHELLPGNVEIRQKGNRVVLEVEEIEEILEEYS